MGGNFPVKKILILVVILALPGFLYYLLQEKGKNRYHPLAIFGPKQLAGTFHKKRGKKIRDTLYHTVPSFLLTNQNGLPTKFPADSGSITVVSFFYTRGGQPCAYMNYALSGLVKEYDRNKRMQFLTISVDPEFDTPPELKKYSMTYSARAGKWSFLTGDQDKIYEIARRGFLVDALRDTLEQGNFIYSPMFILVDPLRRIRGYYDSGIKEQVDKLNDEIKVLIVEELRKVKNPG
ncbi:SCO family protein [Hufsiella ginkgonis]|uniref:SCO family protein n=1 Tax=Hufsiella ginkgonis TaxID=2695274 RepID=A0A7K1Y304_9SPHI|nr:SCO family protein [Hufsiella ginkgonis]MXV17621.1 SCO family protein [Hufsiella ginkgonis]